MNDMTDNDRLNSFAAFALQGMLAHQKRYKPRPNDPQDWHKAIAKEAFEIGEAMIHESSKIRVRTIDMKEENS